MRWASQKCKIKDLELLILLRTDDDVHVDAEADADDDDDDDDDDDWSRNTNTVHEFFPISSRHQSWTVPSSIRKSHCRLCLSKTKQTTHTHAHIMLWKWWLINLLQSSIWNFTSTPNWIPNDPVLDNRKAVGSSMPLRGNPPLASPRSSPESQQDHWSNSCVSARDLRRSAGPWPRSLGHHTTGWNQISHSKIKLKYVDLMVYGVSLSLSNRVYICIYIRICNR